MKIALQRVSATVVASFFILAQPAHVQAQWTVTNLRPNGKSGQANGVGGGQQVGGVNVTDRQEHASRWTGTAASWTDLNPIGGTYSHAYGASGGQQVGVTSFATAFIGPDNYRAALWSGTAASWVDLTPSVATAAELHGVSAGQQVGNATLLGGGVHAGLWTGTAASWVDLNSPGTRFSGANGIQGGQQVGYVSVGTPFPVLTHASLWSGSASSLVDLNPPGAVNSRGVGISGGRQVGFASFTPDGPQHASLWAGTAASWVDMSPVGSTSSIAIGIFDGQQVGTATIGGVPHASIWSGSAASWTDLSLFIPSEFNSNQSHAESIWADSDFQYVVGWSYDNQAGSATPLLWTRPIPAPNTTVMFVLCGLVARRKRK